MYGIKEITGMIFMTKLSPTVRSNLLRSASWSGWTMGQPDPLPCLLNSTILTHSSLVMWSYSPWSPHTLVKVHDVTCKFGPWSRVRLEFGWWEKVGDNVEKLFLNWFSPHLNGPYWVHHESYPSISGLYKVSLTENEFSIEVGKTIKKQTIFPS